MSLLPPMTFVKLTFKQEVRLAEMPSEPVWHISDIIAKLTLIQKHEKVKRGCRNINFEVIYYWLSPLFLIMVVQNLAL